MNNIFSETNLWGSEKNSPTKSERLPQNKVNELIDILTDENNKSLNAYLFRYIVYLMFCDTKENKEIYLDYGTNIMIFEYEKWEKKNIKKILKYYTMQEHDFSDKEIWLAQNVYNNLEFIEKGLLDYHFYEELCEQ